MPSPVRILILVLASTACSKSGGGTAPSSEVVAHGKLRELMHGGDAAGVVALKDVVRPGVIAVGALAQMSGEVTVLDGALRTSSAVGDDVVSRHEAGDLEAALLVVGEVPAWRDVPISEDIAAGELDAAIEVALRGAGVDVSRAVPIVIVGTFPTLDWHVIDGPHTHGEPSGIKRSTPGAATVLGFYSANHEGVFTHMGQRTHLHALVEDATGHVDALGIAAGSTLRVPR